MAAVPLCSPASYSGQRDSSKVQVRPCFFLSSDGSFSFVDWSQGRVYHRQMLCHRATAPTLSENLHPFLDKVYACFTAIEISVSICSRCLDKIPKIGQFINNRCLFRWEFWRLGVGYCRISYHIIMRQKASRGQKEQVYSEWMRDTEMGGKTGGQSHLFGQELIPVAN